MAPPVLALPNGTGPHRHGRGGRRRVRHRISASLLALAAGLMLGGVPALAQDAAPGGVAATTSEGDSVPFFLRPFRTAYEVLRGNEPIDDPDDRRLRDDDEARARAEALAQARTTPTGGLRRFSDDALAEPVPGDRFRTAGQLRTDDLAEQRRQALVGVTVEATANGGVPLPEDDALRGTLGDAARVTGSLRGTADADDPLAPLGLRAGPLTWFPSVELVAGYDSDPDGTGDPVRTLRVAPQLRLESDWVRHELTADVSGSATFYDDERDPALALDGTVALRLDVGRETTATLGAGYALSGEAQDDPNVPGAAAGLTDTQELRGSLEVARRVGPVEASLRGEVARFLFADTPVAAGPDQSNDDRNRTDLIGTLRLERAEGPLIRPFAEGSVTLRRFDEAVDRNGLVRDSLAYGATVGLLVADRNPLRGSLGVGVVGEVFEDDALDDVVALSAQAGLVWDVNALTTASLDVATTLAPTTQAGSGVGITRGATFGLTHQLRRSLELRFGAGIEDTVFSGAAEGSRVYTGTAGIGWTVSRMAQLRLDGTFEHEPDATAGDTNRFAIEAGVTIRR